LNRNFQSQAQYNQFLALRNNYKANNFPQEPSNPNIFGNPLKITHTLNPSQLYNFQQSYSKYPQNLYLGNTPIRIDENLVKFNEESGYKNFNYLGDRMPKKLNATFYPSNEHLYYKNPEMNRENNEYINGFVNNEINRHTTNIIGNSEDVNDFLVYEKKNENKLDANNFDENFLIGENDEFKIKRINSITKFNGQKQIEDFLANTQENRINFND